MCGFGPDPGFYPQASERALGAWGPLLGELKGRGASCCTHWPPSSPQRFVLCDTLCSFACLIFLTVCLPLPQSLTVSAISLCPCPRLRLPESLGRWPRL